MGKKILKFKMLPGKSNRMV